MPLWAIQILLIVLAGGIGGLANAYLVDGGFKKGYIDTLDNGQQIRRPGWIGNVFIGMIAGFVVWVLHGTQTSAVYPFLRQFVVSLLAGAAGGRIITVEMDKRMLAASNDQLIEALKPKRSESDDN